MGTFLFFFVNEMNSKWHIGRTRWKLATYFSCKPVNLCLIRALTNSQIYESKTNVFHFRVSSWSRPTFLSRTFFGVLSNSRYICVLLLGHLPKCGRSDITSALTESELILQAARPSFIPGIMYDSYLLTPTTPKSSMSHCLKNIYSSLHIHCVRS